MILHGYFRSTASWRVRIALNLKGISANQVHHHLRKGGQRAPGFLELNPQGLVPALELDQGLAPSREASQALTQSLAIIEYLDEIHPEPMLLPKAPLLRARVRAVALAIACDIHPIQNLKILDRVRALAGPDAATAWARETIEEGLEAVDKLIESNEGPFSFGAQLSLADLCLVPQLANARRFGVDLRWPRLLAIEAACQALPAFQDAEPENQPDAE
jgi:maleylpyruvate isomerase